MSTAQETLTRTEEQIRTAGAEVARLDSEIETVTDDLTAELAKATVDAGTVGDLETQRDQLEKDRARLLARVIALEATLITRRREADRERLSEAIAAFPAAVSVVDRAVAEWTDAATAAGKLVGLAETIIEKRRALRQLRDEVAYLSEVLGVPFPDELPDASHVSNEAAADLGRVFKLGTVVEVDAYYVTSFEEKLRALHSKRRDEAAAERLAKARGESEGVAS